MNRKSIFLFIAFFMLSTTIACAQGIPVSVGNSVLLTASTDNPAPGQTVTLTARSYSIDINAADITWIENGKQTLKGVGKNILDITAPELGKKIIVDVSAVTTDGIIFSKSVTIISGSVDMITENNGYVHPFFKGKVPLSYQNTIKVTAIPHLADSSGKEYDPKNLVYTWKRNSQVIEDESGYGKQSIELTGEVVPRGYTINVIAAARDGITQTTGYVGVSFISPSISFYTNDPLYGPFFNKAITGIVRIGSQKETGVLAVPFGFLKPIKGLGNLVFTWMINGMEYTELAARESIILRAPSDSAGSSNISLDIKNSKQFLQQGNSTFTASFSKNTQDSTDSAVTF